MFDRISRFGFKKHHGTNRVLIHIIKLCFFYTDSNKDDHHKVLEQTGVIKITVNTILAFNLHKLT